MGRMGTLKVNFQVINIEGIIKLEKSPYFVTQ